jgi:hypothetical protein
MENNRAYLIAGGILLGGAVVGIIYYLIKRPPSVPENTPESMIEKASDVTLYRNPDGTVKVRAKVANIGTGQGYFKIQAIIAAKTCPTGKTGYNPQGEWQNVLACVQQAPGTNGSWCGEPDPTKGWILIAPKQFGYLEANSLQAVPPATYNLYVNAAVKQSPAGPRLYQYEHYIWIPNVTV